MNLASGRRIRGCHQVDDFHSGEPALDDWLRCRARANQASGATRTFAVCDDDKVVGYYALASGAVIVASVPGRFRRNMPDPVPVAILARLAVDQAFQERGLARALFRDAARRVEQAADVIGIRGIVVHPCHLGGSADVLSRARLRACPGEPMTLVVTLADVRAALK